MVIDMYIRRWLFPFLLFLTAIIMSMQVLAQPYDLPLADMTFIVDSGHGGKDDGAQRSDLKEDAINLAIAKKLKAKLIEQGANVIMTREGDYDLSGDDTNNHKQEDLKRRVEIINSGMGDYFISIHLNAFTSASAKGAQVFYQEKNTESEKLAEQIQAQLKENTGSHLSAKIGDYYILKKPSVPGVLVECGFLSNAEEREKLNEDAYQELLAETITKGIIQYLTKK